MRLFLSLATLDCDETALRSILNEVDKRLSFITQNENPDRYGTRLTDIKVVLICTPKKLTNWFYERISIARKAKTAVVSLKINSTRFFRAPPHVQRLMYIENIVRSIRSLQRIAGPDFRGEELITDILNALQVSEKALLRFKTDIFIPAEKAVDTEHIVIDFKYRLSGSEEWSDEPITPEEYFDFDYLEEGEKLVADSIPLYNDLIDYLYYLGRERERIYQISVNITDKTAQENIHFFQTFWNGQKNAVTERVENGKQTSRVLVVSTELPTEFTHDAQPDYEIMRFDMEPHNLQCSYHGIIHDNPDGTQSEIVITEGWRY